MLDQFTASDFDFVLPQELIAQYPAEVRSQSRLLDARAKPFGEYVFFELPRLLQPGDLLVFNDTQVVKARLFGKKKSGGKVELLIERVLDAASAHNEVIAHMRVSKKPAVGAVLEMDGGFTAELLGRAGAHAELFHLRLSAEPYALMQVHGQVPLPPYIEHEGDASDEARYQTVFAKHPGAVAAPTAALHFDQAVLDALAARGILSSSLTLHVGAGTFQPMKSERVRDHVMHYERYTIPKQTLQAIEQCRARAGRVVAIGTTTVRALETYAQTQQATGDTNIFITPGFAFQMVDLLLTNFHLPKSTLMMLVSAFAGYEHTMQLYQHAVHQRYRFFSYGDAALLQRQSGYVDL